MLTSRGIDTFPDREDKILENRYFFDDWFLYAVTVSQQHTYGLMKMREQEYDKQLGVPADEDTPGVTISFVAFDTDLFKVCFENPSVENRKNWVWRSTG